MGRFAEQFKQQLSGVCEVTESTVRWLRFLPRTALQYAANNESLMVFVPVQPWHFAELGVATQTHLSGPGEIDSKVQTLEPRSGHWSHKFALEYCETSLRGLIADSPGYVGSGENQYMVSEIEGLPSKAYGRQQVLLSGLAAQEILISEPIWTTMVAKAKHDPAQFQLMRLVGLHLLETQTSDMQPREFRNWFLGVLSGSIKPPGKKPKSIAIFLRKRTIIALARRLRTHGIEPTTSIHSCQDISGCGIVARAAANVGLAQPRSYEGVRKIWAKRNTY